MNELVCVNTYVTPEEAHVAKLALEAEEIPCYVTDSAAAGLFWYMSDALGGVKLLVAADDVARAKEVLDDAATPGTDRVGDAWKNAAAAGEVEEPQGEDEETPLNDREESAQRAVKGAVLGLLFFPLQFYVLYLLLFKVFASELPLSPRSRRLAWIALAINSLCLLASYFIWRLIYWPTYLGIY
ncbi:MAG: DUF2007 domain-containing protein [Planctomycetota bacterium]|jgi:hypothetical protein